MSPKKQYYENTAKTIIANLEKRQMKGWYCEDSAAAVQKVLELMPEHASTLGLYKPSVVAALCPSQTQTLLFIYGLSTSFVQTITSK